MPQKRMQRQRPIVMHDAGRLDKRHHTAEKIIGRHEIIHAVFDPSVLQKRCNQAKIHRHAAKLKRKDSEIICMLSEIKGMKKLFIDLRHRQKHPDGKQHNLISALADISELSRNDKTKKNADERERQMKRTVCRRLRHFPCRRRHQAFNPIANHKSTSFCFFDNEISIAQNSKFDNI